MDSTAISLIAVVIAFFSVLVPYRLTRRIARHDPVDHFVEGDVPAVPADFKLNHVRSFSTEAQRHHGA